MDRYYLAIDIGASSGRHILGHISGGQMILEEIYRFSNEMIEKNGSLCWDMDQLFCDIKAGMKKCKELNKIPLSVGIDTWAVDFVLLDNKDRMIGDVVAYRDERTKGMDEKVYACILEEELYGKTGIQKQMFNSIYQLMAIKQQHPEYLTKAQTMLMIPDYFNFLLSGEKACEYTNATTTQLVDPMTKTWDMDVIRALGFPEKIFINILKPGTFIGTLTQELQEEIGFNCKVVLPATHDTASAVMAVPGNQENTLYISSGTWSLMGTEIKEANCSKVSREHNFTNEGGYDYRFRYLKNIMGLWMIQSVKKEIGLGYDFGEICKMASKETIPSIVDCNDDRFLAPKNMTEEVRKACAESNQEVPVGIEEVAAVIYNSLAACYVRTIDEIESITGSSYDRIHIVGGGANAEYLNQLTARQTRRCVYAGPTEATAIGNLSAQMIADNALKDLQDARVCIFNSFEIKEYKSNKECKPGKYNMKNKEDY
ncbi:MAG: rhamnulokinase [Velocimicrobium sp.]